MKTGETGIIGVLWVLDKEDGKYKEVTKIETIKQHQNHTEVLVHYKPIKAMKTVDIKAKKKIHKKASKVLNCILLAKQRIDDEHTNIGLWKHYYYYSKEYCLKNIESHKAAIVKLEKYYHKIISQL